jgi:hypothetical protein
MNVTSLNYTDGTVVFVKEINHFLKTEWNVDILPRIIRFYTWAGVMTTA